MTRHWSGTSLSSVAHRKLTALQWPSIADCKLTVTSQSPGSLSDIFLSGGWFLTIRSKLRVFLKKLVTFCSINGAIQIQVLYWKQVFLSSEPLLNQKLNSKQGGEITLFSPFRLTAWLSQGLSRMSQGQGTGWTAFHVLCSIRMRRPSLVLRNSYPTRSVVLKE